MKPILPQALLKMFSLLFSVVVNPRSLRLFVARRQNASLLHPVSYRLLSGSSLIFLPEEPAALTPFQRFCLLREVAHAAAASTSADREGQQVVWCYSMLWLGLLADWSVASVLPLILAALALWRIHVDAELLPEAMADVQMRDQIQADSIALNALK